MFFKKKVFHFCNPVPQSANDTEETLERIKGHKGVKAVLIGALTTIFRYMLPVVIHYISLLFTC